MKKELKLLLPFLFLFQFAFSQDHAIDSLKQLLKTAKHDTVRCEILSQLIERSGDDQWPVFNDELKNISEKNLKVYPANSYLNILFKKLYASTLGNLGYLADLKGNIAKALEYDFECLEIEKQLNDKKAMGSLLNNIASIYDNQGNIPKALEFYNQSLKIREEIGDKNGTATVYNNLGIIYQKQEDHKTALEYYEKALKINKEINNKADIASGLNSIGTVYYVENKNETALKYFNEGLAIREEINDVYGIPQSLNNLSLINARLKDFDKGLENCFRALKIQESIQDKSGMTQSYGNIEGIYMMQKKYDKALDICSKNMKLSKELGFPSAVKSCSNHLYSIYNSMGNYKLALENFQLYIQMRDSITNEKNQKASIRSQFKYAYEKQAAQDSVAHAKESEIKNMELQKQTAELKAKRNQQYALYGGLALVIIFAGFMYNRFKVTHKQKLLIEEKEKETQHQNEMITLQKQIVDEKQKEILDSIHYAKRIQNALITSEKYIDKNLKKLTEKN